MAAGPDEGGFRATYAARQLNRFLPLSINMTNSYLTPKEKPNRKICFTMCSDEVAI
jgi:hypothetical protein